MMSCSKCSKMNDNIDLSFGTIHHNLQNHRWKDEQSDMMTKTIVKIRLKSRNLKTQFPLRK